MLELRDRCPACDLDLGGADVGDGPAAPIILVLGGIVVALAFWVEFAFEPPVWIHALLWPALTVPAAILMTRVVKAGLVAAQFRYRADEMRGNQ